eukprot:COSAG02_NODE_45830_length_353_cov_4.602362_1_plen_61_part_10
MKSQMMKNRMKMYRMVSSGERHEKTLNPLPTSAHTATQVSVFPQVRGGSREAPTQPVRRAK